MPSIGETLVSSRSFEEYRAMFSLSREDLSAQILDCPAGAAGFVSEVNSLGGHATACDLVYSGRTPDELAALAQSEADRGNTYVSENANDYVWKFFADPAEHQVSRQRAARSFATDVREHPERYVAGRLPSLPFADRSFDLVLSSHLLFSYTDRLDHAFHVDAIAELSRISRGDVRIFPLVSTASSETYPEMDSLCRELRSRDIETRIVKVDYEFQRRGDHMMVCRQTS